MNERKLTGSIKRDREKATCERATVFIKDGILMLKENSSLCEGVNPLD